MHKVKSMAIATAILTIAATTAYAQTPAKKGPSDVPLKCRTLSEPDLSTCIRDAQSSPEINKQEPVRKRENPSGRADAPSTPSSTSPATPTPASKPKASDG